MFNRMNIRKKLALVLWGAVLLAFGVAVAVLLIHQNLTLESRARQLMQPYAQMVSVGAEAAVAFEDPIRAQEIIDSLRVNPEVIVAQIVLNDGRVLASLDNRRGGGSRPVSTTPDGITVGDGRAELRQSLPQGGRLYLSMGLAQLREQTQQTLWMLGVAVLVLVAATLAQLMVLRRSIIGPLATLAEATELARTRSDYSRRVPAVGNDEIAKLGQSFNAMLEAVRERECALRRLTAFQRAILDNAAYGIVSVAPEGIVTSYNPAAERLLGYEAGDVVGKQTPMRWHDPEEVELRARELSGELGETIAPDFEVLVARARRNFPDECEWTAIRVDGVRVPILLSVAALREENGQITGFVGLLSDLAERKQAEASLNHLNRELRAISNCNQALMRATDEDALLTEICRLVCEQAGYRMAWVGYAEHDDAKSVRSVAWAGIEDGYLATANVTWADVDQGQGPVGVALRTGESSCVQDFETDSHAVPWRANAMRHGYRSGIALPLKDESATTFGVLAIYSTAAKAFPDDEVRLLEELAGDLAFGICVLRGRVERQHAEEALRVREEKYRTLLQKLQVAVVVHGPDNRIVSCNPMARSFLGLTDDQLPGEIAVDREWAFLRQDGEAMPPGEYPANLAITQGRPVRNLLVGVRRPNHRQSSWVLANADPVFDHEGKIVETIVTFIDITERKLAEEKIIYLASIVESTDDAVIGKSLDETILSWNKGAERIYGYSAAEIIGSPISVLVPPDRRDELGVIMSRLRAGEKIRHHETTRVRKDGRIIDVALTISPIKDANARIVGASIIARDTTVFKRAQQALVASEQRFRDLVNTTDGVVWEFDVNTFRFTFVSEQAERLLGYPAHEWLQEGFWVEHLHPEDKAWAPACCAERTAQLKPHDFEYRFIAKDGRTVWLHDLVTVVAEDGKPRWLRGILVDITLNKLAQVELEQHRHHLEELVATRTQELTQARDAADTANRAKSTFLASMSHELRTPLNAILGYAQLLGRKRQHDQQIQTGLQTIQQAGEHLLSLINNILDLAKIEAGKVELESSAVNVPLLLSQVANLIRVKAEEKGLVFETDVSEDLPVLINADEARLRQVLLNLLSNAVKFTQVGTIKLGAHCLEANSGVTLRFEVWDTGIGIAPSKLDTIFEPFEQAGGAQQRFGGTGLGLTISSQLVRQMGGEIQVESTVGSGSRFWFEANFARASDDDLLKGERTWDLPLGYDGPRKRALVVDDVQTNREILVSLLVPLGFEVLEAVDGRECVFTAINSSPDIILMDMIMPVMDGMESCRELRRLDSTRSIPIIALSANSSSVNKDMALQAGANAFLAKPLEINNLIDLMGELMALQWQQAEDGERRDVASPSPAVPIILPPLRQLQRLLEVVNIGNMRAIKAQASLLRARDERYDEFAEKLEKLADEFRSVAVVELVRAAIHRAKS